MAWIANIIIILAVALDMVWVNPALASTTVLSQGARNVKNASSYGGLSAKGDGVTDDTQAFLDALNIGRGSPNHALNGCFMPVAIYVPPGTYRVSKTLIISENTFFFGEPSAPSTIVLGANSPSFSSGANPFVVTASGNHMQPYSTDWSSRGGSFSTTNNIFYIDIRDVNFTVQSGNPGCSDVFLFAMAQQGSLRNSVLTGTSSQQDVLRTDLDGGGGIIQNVKCSGSPTALQLNNTSQAMFRGCVFNGPVRVTHGELVNFIACTFNDPGNVGFKWTGVYWFGMDDCTFTSGTPFSPGTAHYHIENSHGQAQFTANNVFYNGGSVSGSSAQINAAAKGGPYANPPLPQPSSTCVNVKSYGAKGDGAADDTSAIQSAFSANSEVFFPIGTYVVKSTITMGPGKKMYGQGVSFAGSGSSTPLAPKGGTVIYNVGTGPALSVTGRGIAGVVISNIQIYQNTPNTCLVWNGDQSSIVTDCRFVAGAATSQPLVYFQSGGGFFENGWWPAEGLERGLNVTSTDPLWLYSVQTEHYSVLADMFNGASNVVMLNFQDEFSPAYLSINNSSNIFIQGALSGNKKGQASYDISNSNSTVQIFGALIQDDSQGVVKENGSFYGPTSSSNFATLDGYVRASSSPSPTPPLVGGSPYNGVAAAVPGNVYASNYDLGGNGVGYKDTKGANRGVYRADGVDLKASSDAGTGSVLGWRLPGEWTNYTVNVAHSGQYTVSARLESATGGTFHLAVDGKMLVSSTVPVTGPWDTASSWKTQSLGTVNLTASTHVVQVYVDGAYFDLNYLSFN